MSLCTLLSEWDGTLPPDGAMLEQKIDGWRCLWLTGIDGKARLFSRNGIPLDGADHIAWRLEQMERAAGEPMLFDGEIQVAGTLDATKRWFESGWRMGGEAGVLHLFDCLTMAEWRAGGSDVPLYQRKARLAALIGAGADQWEWRPRSHGRDDPACVRLLPDEWVSTPADVLDAAKRVWAADGEGVVVKRWDAPYRRLRSRDAQKVKPGGPWWRNLRSSPIAA